MPKQGSCSFFFFEGDPGREEPFRLKNKKMPISISYLRKGDRKNKKKSF